MPCLLSNRTVGCAATGRYHPPPVLLSRLALVLHLATAAAVAEPLRFSLPEGGMQNEFYRDGPVAAHVVLRPGPEPRIVVAFPAGNSGAAVWFDAEGGLLAWKPDVAIEPASRAVEGGTLRGVSAVLRASGGAVRVRDVVTGSIRVIREADDGLEPPPAISAVPRRSDRRVTWLRRRIDGAPGYELSIDLLRGRMTGGDGEAVTLHPDAQGEIELRVTALTGEPPLTPLPADELVDEGAKPDPHLRRILVYLSYREKLLAGSWQFATYFGRDTLMSLALLAPAAEPGLVEAGLGAVLERLNAAGEVAHEEAVGEFALLDRGPALDYKMIDDDFMLAAVAARLLLAPGADRARAAAFLARKAGNGGTMGSGLVRNLRFVVAAAAPFARTPGWRRLIPLKDGESVGNWRDSNLGLGGGRYPYDVNGVLVPAALAAAAALRASGLLEPYIDEASDAELARAATLAETWRREAPALFDVALDADAARSEVADYAGRVGIDATDALAALDGGGVRFRAVALDAGGRPIAVQNSDEAMALFFLDPPPSEAARVAASLTQPFPAGLMTGAGLVVANPAYAAESNEPAFDRNHYHGAVIWSWQQALLAAGIDRQLARRDFGMPERRQLEAARSRLRTAIRAADELRGSELWSWTEEDGAWRAVPFGAQEGHETESNAAQLWSAVHLALP
jgi:hypothetical protein